MCFPYIPYINDSTHLGELYCNATFDGVQCWNYTLAGTTAFGACPESHPFYYMFNDPKGEQNRLIEHYLKVYEVFVLI